MQLDPQKYLDLVERAGRLVFWDTETSGHDADYGSIITSSVKIYGRKPVTYAISTVGDDRDVVLSTRGELEDADCVVTYYGRGFDVPMLNTRLVRWGYDPLDPPLHIDMFYSVRRKLQTSRGSQAHLLEFLDTPQQKLTVSPSVWSGLAKDFEKNRAILVRRCESDVRGLEALYRRTRALIRDIKR